MTRATNNPETQAILKPILEAAYGKVCSEYFIDLESKTHNYLDLRGYFFLADIPEIKKKFTFSWNTYWEKLGSKEIAEKRAEAFKTPEGFIKYNLKYFNDFCCRPIDETEEYVACQEYNSDKLIKIFKRKVYEDFTYKSPVLFVLTKEEVLKAKAFYEENYNAFKKRLERFVKVYGLKSVKTRIDKCTAQLSAEKYFDREI